MNDFPGLYRARVVNSDDPQKANRLRLQVPQLMGSSSTPWAEAASSVVAVPNVGDLVWVSFHAGDLAYPIWWGGEPDVASQITGANEYTDEQAAIAAAVGSHAQATATAAQTAATAAQSAATAAQNSANLALRANHLRWAQSASHAVPATTWTDLSWSYEIDSHLDDGGVIIESDQVNFSPNVTGIWLFGCTLTFNASTGVQVLQLITKAGSIIAQSQFDSGSLEVPCLTVTASLELPAGYPGVRARVYSSTAVTTAINGDDEFGAGGLAGTTFTATLIART